MHSLTTDPDTDAAILRDVWRLTDDIVPGGVREAMRTRVMHMALDGRDYTLTPTERIILNTARELNGVRLLADWEGVADNG